MNQKKKHITKIEGYDNFISLAEAIGNLRYDSLIELFDELEIKFYGDSLADKERGREKLANSLMKISNKFSDLKKEMNNTWKICKPYMKDELS